MKFIETEIKDLYIIEPKVFGDNRGYFMESYNKEEFEKNGLFYNFIQDNESSSFKGVLRGLHFQKKFSQAKLVRVIEGEVFDVAVDLRKGSKTYGKYVGVRLSSENKKMFMIPRGFAHGFLVVSDHATFVYKVDNVYHPEDECGIIYNDPKIDVIWPFLGRKFTLSEKDTKHKTLEELNYEYEE